MKDRIQADIEFGLLRSLSAYQPQIRSTIASWGMVLTTFCLVSIVTPAIAQFGPPAGPAPVAPRSPLDGVVISQINVEGLQRIDEAYVRNQIRTQPGQSYSTDQLQRDIAALLRTGRFIDVDAEPRLVNGQVVLTLRLVEKPQVETIEFIGNDKFEDKQLLDELTFAVGDPLDLFDVRQGRRAIERKYQEEGFAFVEVGVDEEVMRDEQRVVYTIVENQQVRTKKIIFDGNVTYDDAELGLKIETKPYFPIFRAGDYDPERAERDAATLQQYYQDRGFLDAEVSYEAEFQDIEREDLHLVFRINEGTRYVISELQFEGNEAFITDELIEQMTILEGDFYIVPRLEQSVKNIQTLYGSNGYIEADVRFTRAFAEEPGNVLVTISVLEREQFRVGWIEVNGNFRTQEKCVRRELDFYPEEIYDITKVREAERDLKRTQLFVDATIEPIAPPDNAEGVRDALVTVVENPQTNQFIAGIGLSSDSGALGNLVLENTNFDLYDTPRSWEEFFKGRSFRGAGQTFRIQMEPGTEFTRFRIDFREPYLLDMPIGFGTSAYLFERGRDGYDENRGGGNFSFDKRFEKGWLKDWIGEIAFRAEYVNVTDRDAFAAEDIRDVDGGSFLTSIKLSLLHDTTDSRFNPSEGHRLQMSWEQFGAMGGDYFFAEAMGRYTQHYTVAIDELDRKSVVSGYVQLGQIFGEAPVFERFYAGGIGSFRGFDYRGISPRQGLRNNRVGGDFMVLTGGEYSFPLYADVIRGVGFLDMGTVEEEFGITTWRAAIGGGIRLTLDILGTVPMEFDFAVPISSGENDDERIFSFFIGLPFL